MSEKTKTKYVLTDEHRAQQKPWADKWISVAMSTAPMSVKEKADAVGYVYKLYEAADLARPEDVLFVKSPFAMVVAGGFAAAICEMGKDAPLTVAELVNRLNSGELNSPMGDSNWYMTPYNMKALSESLGLGQLGVECVRQSHRMWNGGNQWAGWSSYISFFRYIAKLDIDYSKWDCYEKLTEISGPRVVHSKFCIISDRPEVLTVNERNQPHGVDKPFCKWRDGSSLYSVNGVRVPAYIIDNPSKLTVAIIESESNLEVRRVMIDVYGREKYILDSNSEIVNVDDFGTLYKKSLTGDEELWMVKVVNSTPEPDGTFKDYFIRVDPTSYDGLKTARAAVASTWRKADGSMLFKSPDDYVCEVET